MLLFLIIVALVPGKSKISFKHQTSNSIRNNSVGNIFLFFHKLDGLASLATDPSQCTPPLCKTDSVSSVCCFCFVFLNIDAPKSTTVLKYQYWIKIEGNIRLCIANGWIVSSSGVPSGRVSYQWGYPE